MLCISNFVLELYNINFIIMKKAVLIIVVSLLIATGVGFLIFGSNVLIETQEVISVLAIFILAGFFIYKAYEKISKARKGEAAEDELSKKVLQKSSSISYYISLYLWLLLSYFSDRIDFTTEELIGTGIIGMALIFGIIWMVINVRGLRNG